MALQPSIKGKGRVPEDDPTESLKKVLASFQSILTAEQQQEFKDSTTVPDAEGVLFFVAKLDAENSSKTRRSVSPRLCNFLSAIQQFAGAVETFVSSNPRIAALVWGGIKTAITVASNVASYFDKVTNMIMEIGLVCPTFQEFGHIYHGCLGLQHALCGYYSVIVELCIKIIEVSRRTYAAQTISSIWSPFESEFKSFLDRLESARYKIELQTKLASAQAEQETKKLLEFESQENASFRPSALKLLQRSSNQYKETRQWQINRMKRETASLKTKIRQTLSSVDHIRPWKRVLKQRVHLTAEWLMKEPIFLKCKECPETAILWCSGTMGMGKTVLISNVIAYLHSCREENETISHYFCSSEDQESLTGKKILGSISRQLLDFLIERSDHESLLSMQNDCQNLDTSETVVFLLSKLEREKPYYIVLDGLDECKPGLIRDIAQALTALCRGPAEMKLKIICSGRPDLEEDLFKWTQPQYRLVIDQRMLSADIDRYVVTSLSDHLEDGLLVLRDPEIFMKIVDVLRDNSKGMFLWAGLCIEELCEKNCDEDILEALNHLPRGLAELFDLKVARIKERQDGSLAMKLLQYCGVVKRPLNVEEFREALAISIDDKILDSRKLPNNMNRIVRGCSGLAFIDDEEQTVHYIHQSVKDHLYHDTPQMTAQFEPQATDEHFGVLCMTYLNFGNLSRQLVRDGKAERTVVRPFQVGTSSITGTSSGVVKIAQKLLARIEKAPGMEFSEFERTTLEAFGGSQPQGVSTGNPFLGYAKDHWFLHLKNLKAEKYSKKWTLFQNCIEDRTLPLDRPWESSDYQPRNEDRLSDRESVLYFTEDLSSSLECRQHELLWTLKNNHYALFLYFTKKRKVDKLSRDIHSFPRSNDGGSHHWADMLIDAPNFTRGWNLALFGVAQDEGIPEAKRLQILHRLLQKMTSVNAKGARFALGMAHRHAIFKGQMLDFLLDIDKSFYQENRVMDERLDNELADDYFDEISFDRRDPVLIIAARRGYREMMKLILDAGAKVDVLDTSGKTALFIASAQDQIDLIQTLQAAGVDINSRDHEGMTALQGAVWAADIAQVRILLAAGARINLADNKGKTALHQAAAGGLRGVVKELVATGAKIDLIDDKGETALHKAAKWGRIDVMNELLAAGADVELKNKEELTALDIALHVEACRASANRVTISLIS